MAHRSRSAEARHDEINKTRGAAPAPWTSPRRDLRKILTRGRAVWRCFRVDLPCGNPNARSPRGSEASQTVPTAVARPMGCGASIFGRRDSKRQPLLSARRGLVTPPQGSERPGAKGAGLRIDTNLPSRKDVAVAETPVGKQAEEYKYYCPLCMCANASSQSTNSPVSCNTLPSVAHTCYEPALRPFTGCSSSRYWRCRAASSRSAPSVCTST